MGSFQIWAEVMGGILDACGVRGFLGNLDLLDLYVDGEESGGDNLLDAAFVCDGRRPLSGFGAAQTLRLQRCGGCDVFF